MIGADKSSTSFCERQQTL